MKLAVRLTRVGAGPFVAARVAGLTCKPTNIIRNGYCISEHMCKMSTSGWEREVDSSCRGFGLALAAGCDDDGRDAGGLFCVKHTWSSGIVHRRLRLKYLSGRRNALLHGKPQCCRTSPSSPSVGAGAGAGAAFKFLAGGGAFSVTSSSSSSSSMALDCARGSSVKSDVILE